MLVCIVVGGGEWSLDEDGREMYILGWGVLGSKRMFVVGQSILPGLVEGGVDFVVLLFGV